MFWVFLYSFFFPFGENKLNILQGKMKVFGLALNIFLPIHVNSPYHLSLFSLSLISFLQLLFFLRTPALVASRPSSIGDGYQSTSCGSSAWMSHFSHKKAPNTGTYGLPDPNVFHRCPHRWLFLIFQFFWLSLSSIYICFLLQSRIIFAPEELQLLRTTANKCFSETGVDPDVVIYTEEGGYYTDQLYKDFLYCAFYTSGLGNSDGTIKVDKLIGILPTEFMDISEVIIDCSKPVEGDAREKTYQFFKCFQENSRAVLGICYENNKNVCKWAAIVIMSLKS